MVAAPRESQARQDERQERTARVAESGNPGDGGERARVQGIRTRCDLVTVAHAVAVGVRVEGVGSGVARIHEDTGVGLDAVGQAVVVAVWCRKSATQKREQLR